ncbi:hypothetical protein LCGC14_2280640, partial [marine sediment metagenome]
PPGPGEGPGLECDEGFVAELINGEWVCVPEEFGERKSNLPLILGGAALAGVLLLTRGKKETR